MTGHEQLKHLDYSAQFKKDLKRIIKRNWDDSKLDHVVLLLRKGEELPLRYRAHQLTGNWQKYLECHISADWLLVYQVAEDAITLVRTGSHTDLFG